jgi:hypothetical protein
LTGDPRNDGKGQIQMKWFSSDSVFDHRGGSPDGLPICVSVLLWSDRVDLFDFPYPFRILESGDFVFGFVFIFGFGFGFVFALAFLELLWPGLPKLSHRVGAELPEHHRLLLDTSPGLRGHF